MVSRWAALVFMEKQKDIFLLTEGDAWFERNFQVVQSTVDWENDPVVKCVNHCIESTSSDCNVLLEIGCGTGSRLQWLQKNAHVECYGIDPSAKAISVSRESGVNAIRGTADSIAFPDESFDFVVFGFCLYLCDRDDLFNIASEAYRVLKKESWLIVHDFYSKTPIRRAYHHREGLYSYKMDYRSIFDWHPDFTCLHHEVRHHKSLCLTDEADEWVATSVLRKCAT
jgi:SAM-dependent methyltransferase